jgi:hypothetical protein
MVGKAVVMMVMSRAARKSAIQRDNMMTAMRAPPKFSDCDGVWLGFLVTAWPSAPSTVLSEDEAEVVSRICCGVDGRPPWVVIESAVPSPAAGSFSGSDIMT